MNELTLNQYQDQASITDIASPAIIKYVEALNIPDNNDRLKLMALLRLLYMSLGLTGEAGEIANKVKKIVRDADGDITLSSLIAVGKEAGDCLWYLSKVSECVGYTLEEVAQNNLKTLQKRLETSTLNGNGDNREEI